MVAGRLVTAVPALSVGFGSCVCVCMCVIKFNIAPMYIQFYTF